jgi:hypothetical protein
MYKSNGTAYSLERGVYVSNYIENPSISFTAGAATVDGKYFFENKIPYHNTNS